VFIRRSIKNEPVYKLVLREYIGYLVRKRFNLEWYIEGGRTRTGKLRPPRYGLLNYLVEEFREGASNDVMLIPTSIVYDQLYEVGAMAAEEHGAKKTPESLSWLIGYARAQGRGFGKVRVEFGEPLSLCDALEESREHEHPVERVAFEVCHRINRATPITESALVTLALLGAEDRALTLEEVRCTLRPLLEYVTVRNLPMTAELDLRTADGVGQALAALSRHGVVTRYDGGLEPVWSISPERHLEAAFYRNSIVHLFLGRAIAELVLMRVAEEPVPDAVVDGWEEAVTIRDLLKFEFFFARKRVFGQELREEIELIDPGWERRAGEPGAARGALERSQLLLAPRVLGSFLEAYLVAAERLAAAGDAGPIDQEALVTECLGVAHQQRLQRRLKSTESISRELFSNALKLADNRGLLGPGAAEGREALAAGLQTLVRRIDGVRALASA
jgi:glycerol-3-phosphate O-acyltransferase